MKNIIFANIAAAGLAALSLTLAAPAFATAKNPIGNGVSLGVVAASSTSPGTGCTNTGTATVCDNTQIDATPPIGFGPQYPYWEGDGFIGGPGFTGGHGFVGAHRFGGGGFGGGHGYGGGGRHR
jgi:hypothetical protein